MSVISLTTDFGQKDGFAGTLKGVIWSIAPEVQIADISHDIPPQDVRAGSLALCRAAPFFPAGTVHIAVIDPGVGTSRRPMAARLGYQFFVLPDNGLLTPLIIEAEAANLPIEFVHLDKPEYWLPRVSHTFHGRDIFAPVGAHLANGVPIVHLGTLIHDPVRLQMTEPEPIPGGWRAHVKSIDTFGNLITDLHADQLRDMGELVVRVMRHDLQGLVASYGHGQPGDLVAVINSEDYLEVAVVNGSAAKVLRGKVGDVIEVVRKQS